MGPSSQMAPGARVERAMPFGDELTARWAFLCPTLEWNPWKVLPLLGPASKAGANAVWRHGYDMVAGVGIEPTEPCGEGL